MIKPVSMFSLFQSNYYLLLINLSIHVQYLVEQMEGVDVMRTQADEKMKSAERMIVENRRKTAKTIHAERSLSKTTNDKLKYLATTALSMERSGNRADKDVYFSGRRHQWLFQMVMAYMIASSGNGGGNSFGKRRR